MGFSGEVFISGYLRCRESITLFSAMDFVGLML